MSMDDGKTNYNSNILQPDITHLNVATTFNESLFDSFFSYNSDFDVAFNETLYVCGEALSHCVRYSILDILEKLEKLSENKPNIKKTKKVVLLINASSLIPSYESAVYDFLTNANKGYDFFYINWILEDGSINDDNQTKLPLKVDDLKNELLKTINSSQSIGSKVYISFDNQTLNFEIFYDKEMKKKITDINIKNIKDKNSIDKINKSIETALAKVTNVLGGKKTKKIYLKRKSNKKTCKKGGKSRGKKRGKSRGKKTYKVRGKKTVM
jgi:hypothetical protein